MPLSQSPFGVDDAIKRVVERLAGRDDLTVDQEIEALSAIGSLDPDEKPEVQIARINAEGSRNAWLKDGLLTAGVAAFASVATGYFAGFFSYQETIAEVSSQLEVVKHTQRGELQKTELEQRAAILERLLVIDPSDLGVAGDENADLQQLALQERKARICLLATFGIIAIPDSVVGVEVSDLKAYSTASQTLLNERYSCDEGGLPERLPVSSPDIPVPPDVDDLISKEALSASIERGKDLLARLTQNGFAGYDEAFLSHPLDFEIAGADKTLDYIHFSISMDASRPYARAAAWNIDGSSLKRLRREGGWGFDPRLSITRQAGNELYSRNPLDRGHLVRRLDVAWGSDDRALLAGLSAQNFYTNATPQHQMLNQREWLAVEDYILEFVEGFKHKATVFAGPFIDEADPVYRGISVPRAFWKLAIVENAAGEYYVGAFILDQTQFLAADLDLKPEPLNLNISDGLYPDPPTEFQTFAVHPDFLIELVGLEISLPPDYAGFP